MTVTTIVVMALILGFVWGGFARVGRFRTPTRSVVFTGAVMVFCLLAFDVEAVAKLIKEPMFVATFDGEPRARFYGGQEVAGKRHGPAKCEAGALDVSAGGHATFPHDGRFDLAQPLSIECRVFFDKPTQMPVILSCGHWRRAGWFLQWIGGKWRWHVGGFDCDGGKPEPGRWLHVVGTYDGTALRLFQDGRLVAEQPGTFNTAPFPGDLHVGQYSGGPAPEFQVIGKIQDVKLYHRALGAEEVAELAGEKPQ